MKSLVSGTTFGLILAVLTFMNSCENGSNEISPDIPSFGNGLKNRGLRVHLA